MCLKKKHIGKKIVDKGTYLPHENFMTVIDVAKDVIWAKNKCGVIHWYRNEGWIVLGSSSFWERLKMFWKMLRKK